MPYSINPFTGKFDYYQSGGSSGTMSAQNANAVAITGGTIVGLTGLAIRDTSAAFDVTLAATSSPALTAGRTLTFDLANAGCTLKMTGNAVLNQDVSTAGTPVFPTIYGSAASGGTLTLASTSHATKGKILFGTSAYDEVHNRLGIGTTTPNFALDVSGDLRLNSGVFRLYTGSTEMFNFYASSANTFIIGEVGTMFFQANVGDINFMCGTSILFRDIADPYTIRCRIKLGSVGTASAPTLYLDEDANTGLFHPEADTLAISTNGQESLRINAGGNVGIGVTSFGTSATKTLGLGTGVAPTTAPADMIQIYSTDISAGNCVMGVYQEYAPYAGIGIASTHKIPVKWNGVAYYILATTVA